MPATAVEVSLCSETGARECSSGLQKSESIVKLLSRPKSQHFTFLFLDVNLQDFVLKFFAEELFLIPENGTYRPRPRCGGTPKFRWPLNLHTCVVPIGTIKMRARYSCGAAVQCQRNYYYCLIAPPLDLTYLILSRT